MLLAESFVQNSGINSSTFEKIDMQPGFCDTYDNKERFFLSFNTKKENGS